MTSSSDSSVVRRCGAAVVGVGIAAAGLMTAAPTAGAAPAGNHVAVGGGDWTAAVGPKATIVGPKGPAGPRGPVGPQGPTGQLPPGFEWLGNLFGSS